MGTIMEILTRGVDQLLGRAGGPMHFRLFMMPTMVTFLAIRAGMRDAREAQPAFLWTLISKPAERRRLIRSAVKDIGRVFIFALVLDTIYQLTVLRAFYPVQLLIVAVVCAVVPYVLIRGPVTRLMRLLQGNRTRPVEKPGAGPDEVNPTHKHD